jgi:hypothetical protein
MKGKLYIMFLFGGLLLASCQWQLEHGVVGNASADIKVQRFDKLQEEYVALNSFSALQKMSTDYPQETKFLIENVLSIGSVSDDNINLRMREYYSDTILRALSRDAQRKFQDMDGIERDFTRAFKRLKRELPHMTIPRVYAQFSALNQSIVVGDSTLGFSIDKYMGSDYPLYARFYYPYQRSSMSVERIVPDCLNFYLLSEYPFPWEWHRTLLDHLLHQGKINWVVAQALGTSTLEEVIGFTSSAGEWCRIRRENIWNYLVESGQLHSTDPMWVEVYLQPAECTFPLGVDSPGEVGVWLGIHLIDEYMAKNKHLTIADLLRETDYRSILKNLQLPY